MACKVAAMQEDVRMRAPALGLLLRCWFRFADETGWEGEPATAQMP
jgi:hypothetical protein